MTRERAWMMLALFFLAGSPLGHGLDRTLGDAIMILALIAGDIVVGLPTKPRPRIDWSKAGSYLVPKSREPKVFVAGTLSGAALVAVSWIAIVWWTHPTRSAEDNAAYDVCLANEQGNTVACDAWMRTRERQRAFAALKKKTELLLAGGYTKREVVEWALKEGSTESDVAYAVGISLEDLQQGKY